MSTASRLLRRLRPYRERHFLTQEELAEKLGISLRSVQEYEADRSTPRPQTLRRISELLAEDQVA